MRLKSLTLGFSSVVALLLASSGLASSSSAWNIIDAEHLQKRLANSEELTLVAFVAPEDEMSKPLLPEWQAVQSKSSSAVAVDCIKSAKACQSLDVQTFPAIRLYQAEGQMARYRGPRKASAIEAFVSRMSRDIVTEITEESATSFFSIDDIVIVAELRAEDEAVFESFYNVAEQYRDRYTFGVRELMSGPSTVRCRNNLDDMERAAKDLERVDALKELIEKCSMPLVLPLTRRNELAFNEISKSPVYYFSDEEADRYAFVSMARPAAKAFEDFLAFATVDTNEYPHMPRTFGLGGTRGLCLVNRHNGMIFHFDGDVSTMTTDSLQSFIVAVSEGKLKPWQAKNPADASHDEL